MFRKRSFSQSAALGAVVFSVITGCDPVPRHELTSEEKRTDMYAIYDLFKNNYAPLDYKMERKGVGFEELKDKYLNKALETKSNEEFYRVEYEFIAEFEDAHTSASLHYSDLENRGQIAYLGISGKRVGGLFVVTEILDSLNEGSTAYPLRVGDEISELNGAPLTDLIEQEMTRLRNLGQSDSNQTFHMNRLFSRVSPPDLIPDEEFAEVTIVRRDYTAEEKRRIESQEDRKLEEDEKKEVRLKRKVPWIKKDLGKFKRERAEAARLDLMASRDNEASKQLESDPFIMAGMIEDHLLNFGFRAFDGSVLSKSFFKRLLPHKAGMSVLNNFFIPDQIDSWTMITGLKDKEGSETSSFKRKRHVPKGAKFVTSEDAYFPTYWNKEPVYTKDGKKTKKLRKVATMYVKTFSIDDIDGAIKEFKETLRKLQDEEIDTLIIDTINNGGGYLQLGVEMGQSLSPNDIEMPKLQVMLNDTWMDEFETLSKDADSEAERQLMKPIYEKLNREKQQGKRLSSPVDSRRLFAPLLSPNEDLNKPFKIALLVNEMCASMCDIFASIMQDNKMAVIVGSRTMGAGGNVVTHPQTPNSKLFVRQTESLMLRSDGKTYVENNGVEPDVKVDMKKAYANKYKLAREKAVEAINVEGDSDDE